MPDRPRTPSVRHPRLIAALFAGSLVVLSSCSGPIGPPSPTSNVAPAPPVPRSTTALPVPTAPELPSDGRPIQPVPAVRPSGFAAAPPGAGLARYTQQPLRWRPCSRDLQCATVLAPLDYDRPDSQAITLALAKRPASAARVGTLFINPGGPGGSGMDYVATFDRARRD